MTKCPKCGSELRNGISRNTYLCYNDDCTEPEFFSVDGKLYTRKKYMRLG